MIQYNNICKTKSVFPISLLMYYHIWYRGPRRTVIWSTTALEPILVWWKLIHVIIVSTKIVYMQYHNGYSNSIIDVLLYMMSWKMMRNIMVFWKQCATIIQSFNNALSITIGVKNWQITLDRYDFVWIWPTNQLK
jgi:hypothetical protein